jgi:hypothetical protein
LFKTFTDLFVLQKEKIGTYRSKPKFKQGIKKPGSVNRAFGVLGLTVVFSLDLLSFVQSFSFY